VDCGDNNVNQNITHTACIKTDGTLWTWGYNASGELGLQDIAERSSPVQVGSLTNWKQVGTGGFNTVCVKVDGTLWTWGVNFSGQLGLEDTTARSSPVQVGSLTNWKQVSVGKESSGCIKTDGTLWTWGGSTDGQLGIGSSGFFGRRSSPVQVGTLTNWKQVNSGQYHFVCIKTDGTLWIWGNNGFGRLGLGDSTNRSSPVQVGSLTNFKQASAATHTSCILDATF
jgi:alpha-tubulin suppressor-like RCC1 family protein